MADRRTTPGPRTGRAAARRPRPGATTETGSPRPSVQTRPRRSPEGAPTQATTVTVPVPAIAVRRVRVPLPKVASLPALPGAVATSATRATGELPSSIRRHLPPRDRMLYYAGLGALAALEVVSWPVAAAIGGGVWVASRARTSTPS